MRLRMPGGNFMPTSVFCKIVGEALQVVIALDELHLLNFSRRHQQEKLGRAFVRLIERDGAPASAAPRALGHAAIDVVHAHRSQASPRRRTGIFREQRQHVVMNRIVALAALVGDLAQMFGLVTRAAGLPCWQNVLSRPASRLPRLNSTQPLRVPHRKQQLAWCPDPACAGCRGSRRATACPAR